MTHKEFVHILRGQFWGLLRRKTGWGRNELIEVFNQACVNALAKELDQREVEILRLPNGSEAAWVDAREYKSKGDGTFYRVSQEE